MCDSLKTCFLIIRRHFTLNKFYHQPKTDMKSDKTLSDLNNMKFSEKKTAPE